MRPLRRWFGPSKEAIWRELSTQIGAEYVDGGFWKGDKVQAKHGEWTITLDSYTVHANNAHIPYTRMRAPYVNPGGLRFEIYRKGVFTGLGKLLGMQDVEIGDSSFDDRFVVKASNEAQVRELLSDSRLRALLEAQPKVHLSVKDDEGWFGADFPDGVDTLHFAVPGHIKNVEQLKLLYELFAATLDELCRIGSAYETAPGITI